MHTSIDFPHLGIHLANVGKQITVGSFPIAFYGITIGIGMLLGIYIAAWQAKKTGQDPDIYFDLGLAGIIVGVIGARIYYVAFSWSDYKGDLLSILNIREGGLAIYGGVIGAIITVFTFARIRKMSAGLLFDTAGPGLVAGQMIGRWGNFFNREAFGEYTDGLFAMRLPVDAVRPGDITDRMLEHVEVIDKVRCIQVTPTFLFESVLCAAIFLFLVFYTKHKKFDGEVFLLYLMCYGLGRFFIEGLRTDSLMLPFGNLRVSQVLAAVIVVVSAGMIAYFRKKNRAGRGEISFIGDDIASR